MILISSAGREELLEIIKSFSSSDHYTPLHYTELAVVSVDNFPSELLADFPAAGWLRPVSLRCGGSRVAFLGRPNLRCWWQPETTPGEAGLGREY